MLRHDKVNPETLRPGCRRHIMPLLDEPRTRIVSRWPGATAASGMVAIENELWHAWLTRGWRLFLTSAVVLGCCNSRTQRPDGQYRAFVRRLPRHRLAVWLFRTFCDFESSISTTCDPLMVSSIAALPTRG